VGDLGGAPGPLDGFFCGRVERRAIEPHTRKGRGGGIPGGGLAVFVSDFVPAQDQGPVGFVRVGGILPEGVAGDVRDGPCQLSGLCASALAVLGIHVPAHLGNGDHGDADGLALCSGIGSLLTNESQSMNLSITTLRHTTPHHTIPYHR